MGGRRREILAVLLLVAVAAASWWLKQSVEPAVRFEPRPANAPDYWVERLNTHTTDALGRTRRVLSAASMRHFPGDDSTELTAPELLLLEPGRPPWRIRAESGWVSADGELVLLRGAVKVDREAGDGVMPVSLRTRDLRVQPKQEYAETEYEVYAETPSGEVRSRGMQVWLREPVRIKLLAEVRARYEVKP